MIECPDADTLAAVFGGADALDRRAAIATHAAACESCRAVLAALLDGSVDATLPSTLSDVRLPVGTRIDRYVLTAWLGAGGMGVVYAADDPELGRRVAVKLLRRSTDRDRLRREAQALARLSHPAVVAIHDVGEHAGQVFIAMALVDGDDLRRWLRTPRSTATILACLITAGRGLAAAHAAGLVHRDLKPDNLFIARDGRALIGDFGLARTVDDLAVVGQTDSGTKPSRAFTERALTETGATVGTPAYMAPEQAEGNASPASDQFSFCVTAWEALFGARPFAGATFAEVQRAIRAGHRAAPARDRAVPPTVMRALARGLSADPAARWPSMDALLAALTARPRRRWLWIAAAAAVVLGGATAIAALPPRRSLGDRDACPPLPPGVRSDRESQTTLAASLWSRAAREPIAFARALMTFERRAEAWRALRIQVCRRAPPTFAANRAACLDHHAAALRATVAAIAATPTMTASLAWQAADRLGAIDHCATVREVAPPRSSPELDAARMELATLTVRSDGARGSALAALAARVDALDDPALQLEVQLLAARHALDHGDSVSAERGARAALALGDRLGDDRGRAHAGALLTRALLHLGRDAEARGQLTQATSALARSGDDWEIGLVLTDAAASVARAAGALEAELDARTRILRELRRHHPDDSPLVIDAAVDVVGVGHRLGRLDRVSEARAVVDASLGTDPASRQAQMEAAALRSGDGLTAGEFAVAVAAQERVVVLARELDPDGRFVALQLTDLGVTHELAGDWIAAGDAYRASAELWLSLPADAAAPGALADALEGRARIAVERGSPRDAIAPARAALVRARAAGDRERLQTATLVLARALVALDQHDEAAALTAPIVRELDGSDDQLAARRAGAAFTLAQALWATGGLRDRDRARALAVDAARDFARARDRLATTPALATALRLVEHRLAAVAAWQARHP